MKPVIILYLFLLYRWMLMSSVVHLDLPCLYIWDIWRYAPHLPSGNNTLDILIYKFICWLQMSKIIFFQGWQMSIFKFIGCGGEGVQMSISKFHLGGKCPPLYFNWGQMSSYTLFEWGACGQGRGVGMSWIHISADDQSN